MKQVTTLSLLFVVPLSTSLAWAQGPGPGEATQPAPPVEAPPAPPGDAPADPPAPPPPAEQPPVSQQPPPPAKEPGMGESYGEPDPTGGMGPNEPDEQDSGFPFKRRGQVIFGLEHVAGIYAATSTTKIADPDPFFGDATREEEESFLRISMFGEGGGAFLAPKFGVDVVVAPPLTLGANIYFVTMTTQSESKVGTETMTGPELEASGFGFNPRIGVALGEKPMVWLRGGIAYATASIADSNPSDALNTELDASFTAVSFEAAIGIVSNRGFGIGFGPAVYIPISETRELGGVEATGVEYSSFSWLIAGTGYFAP